MLNSAPLSPAVSRDALADNQTFQNSSAAASAVIVKGAPSQSANIFVVQNSAGTTLFAVDPSGNLVITGTATVVTAETANAMTITGSLGVAGVSTLATLSVTGTSIFTGSATANGSLVAGSSLTVLGVTTLNGLASLNGTLTIGDAVNVVLNTGTGTKIGTAAGQKLGFFNHAPVVQQTGSAWTNSVTPGGSTDVANDIAAADVDTSAAKLTDTRDAIYQLALKVAQLNTAVRNLGLLS